MRGRKALPTALKIAKGTLRKCREIEQEPLYGVQSSYPAPDTLNGLALVQWQRLEPMLRKLDVIRESDLIALEVYCQMYAVYMQAQNDIKARGILITSDGAVRKNPALTAASAASVELRGLSALLGLDPASRMRIGKVNHY